jgi:hypothetical protein
MQPQPTHSQTPPAPADISQPALPEVPTTPTPFDVPSLGAPTAQDSTPAMADDGDLIEKEWVTKVKQVIATTADDPYEQNKKFSQLKADYLQKRYGKTIKSED